MRTFKGSIEINESTVLLHRDGRRHYYKFGIQTGNRILELSADDEDERSQWIHAIQSVIRRHISHNTNQHIHHTLSNSTNELSSSNEIIEVGWLQKKGSVVKNWKRRWFVLKKHTLEYFFFESETPNEFNQRGFIDLDSSTKVLIQDGIQQHQFIFGVQTGKRVLELSAESDMERLRWMDAIHRVINMHSTDMNSKGSKKVGVVLSSVLSKKCSMEEDTLMNRALMGQRVKPPPVATSETMATCSSTVHARRKRTTGGKPMRSRGRLTHTHNGKTAEEPQSENRGDSSDESKHDDRRDHIRAEPQDEIQSKFSTQSKNSSEDVNTLPGKQSDLPSPTTEAESTSTTVSNETKAPSFSPEIECESDIPPGWEAVQTEDGRTYYYHTVTRISRWDLPSGHVTSALNQRLDESKKYTDEKIERRRVELEQVRLEEERIAAEMEKLKAGVRLAIERWRHPTDMKRPRSLGELLSNIPDLLGPTICPEFSISRSPLTLSTSPTEIKKAYLKAVRLVHPDKLAAVDVDIEKKMLAHEVFIRISEEYVLFRKAHDL
eukprot:CAMPEP_0185032910 /NCGR_PEP_ID=MMETSP1103-20130426/21438_1 /TAXON_ID=36769 /ORGANISM="Paraphysomonas bandaiensis, Strain Caron Lab Isolate" /LENGTH=548 /DNA_ID=CAMNT_0027568993 /DNA_START=327 /DNA_END=1973 /DNA_ORIENTATION=-